MCTPSTIKISIYLAYDCTMTFKIHNLQTNVFWNAPKKDLDLNFGDSNKWIQIRDERNASCQVTVLSHF